jgi:hypothetical protein
MAAINRPKHSKQEVSQRFNLKELLGYEPTERQKKMFYELAVNKMVQRTADGDDIDGIPFTPYSEKYAKRKGVTIEAVDLILTGKMLSSFEDSQAQKNVVKVKISEGKETLKAYNHCYGDTLPQRNFFGIVNEDDVNSIVKEVDSVKDEPAAKKGRINLSDLRDAVRVISADFGDFNGQN